MTKGLLLSGLIGLLAHAGAIPASPLQPVQNTAVTRPIEGARAKKVVMAVLQKISLDFKTKQVQLIPKRLDQSGTNSYIGSGVVRINQKEWQPLSFRVFFDSAGKVVKTEYQMDGQLLEGSEL